MLSKSFLLFPVNKSGNHWGVIIVCYPYRLGPRVEAVEGAPCPVILYLDSMRSRGRQDYCYIEHMRAFLKTLWNGLHTDAQVETLAIQGFCLSPPQQPNYDDCGLYVLKSMQLFCLETATSMPVDILETHNCECACINTH